MRTDIIRILPYVNLLVIRIDALLLTMLECLLINTMIVINLLQKEAMLSMFPVVYALIFYYTYIAVYAINCIMDYSSDYIKARSDIKYKIIPTVYFNNRYITIPHAIISFIVVSVLSILFDSPILIYLATMIYIMGLIHSISRSSLRFITLLFLRIQKHILMAALLCLLMNLELTADLLLKILILFTLPFNISFVLVKYHRTPLTSTMQRFIIVITICASLFAVGIALWFEEVTKFFIYLMVPLCLSYIISRTLFREYTYYHYVLRLAMLLISYTILHQSIMMIFVSFT